MKIQRFVNGVEITEPNLNGLEVSNETLDTIFRSVCERAGQTRPSAAVRGKLSR